MQPNRYVPYLVVAAAVVALLAGAGVRLASFVPFLVLLACPLMMILMMRGMAGGHRGEDHSGHGCDHDPDRAGSRHTETHR